MRAKVTARLCMYAFEGKENVQTKTSKNTKTGRNPVKSGLILKLFPLNLTAESPQI